MAWGVELGTAYSELTDRTATQTQTTVAARLRAIRKPWNSMTTSCKPSNPPCRPPVGSGSRRRPGRDDDHRAQHSKHCPSAGQSRVELITGPNGVRWPHARRSINPAGRCRSRYLCRIPTFDASPRKRSRTVSETAGRKAQVDAGTAGQTPSSSSTRHVSGQLPTTGADSRVDALGRVRR